MWRVSIFDLTNTDYGNQCYVHSICSNVVPPSRLVPHYMCTLFAVRYSRNCKLPLRVDTRRQKRFQGQWVHYILANLKSRTTFNR